MAKSAATTRSTDNYIPFNPLHILLEYACSLVKSTGNNVMLVHPDGRCICLSRDKNGVLCSLYEANACGFGSGKKLLLSDCNTRSVCREYELTSGDLGWAFEKKCCEEFSKLASELVDIVTCPLFSEGYNTLTYAIENAESIVDRHVLDTVGLVNGMNCLYISKNGYDVTYSLYRGDPKQFVRRVDCKSYVNAKSVCEALQLEPDWVWKMDSLSANKIILVIKKIMDILAHVPVLKSSPDYARKCSEKFRTHVRKGDIVVTEPVVE